MKITKKRSLILLTAIMLAATLNICFALISGAQPNDPEVEIKYCNLSFSDNIRIKYAVKSNVDNVELLIWSSPMTDYTIDNDPFILTDSYTENIGGVPHAIFDYDELSAKNMTDYVYARAHVRVGDVDYYSDVSKYSILQYAHNMLEKTSDPKLVKLLENMLSYGAAVQEYKEYKTDALPNADWLAVRLTAGSLPDGMLSGLYLEGDKVTLTAPSVDSNGMSFSHWIDSSETVVSSEPEFVLTVGDKDETYTPVYVDYSVMLKYTSNGDGTYSVAGIGDCRDTVIYIPKETSTGRVGKVTSIADNAFKGNKNITSVIIPEGVTSIGWYAFEGCENLESITLPSTLKTIYSYAFNMCPKLKCVKYNGTLEGWLGTSFPYSYGSPLVNGAELYFGSKLVTEITLPDSLTSIPTGAFAGCSSLKKVTLHDNVTKIGGDAFRYCSALESINIPEGVTLIGGYAFQYCAKLKSIVIPNSVNDIGSDGLFTDCKSLESAVIGNGVQYVGSWFSGCTNLKSVKIGTGADSIQSMAFSGCTSLESITFPANIKRIGESAFSGCSSLKDVYYLGSINEWWEISIGTNNTKLTSATIHYNSTANFASVPN